MCKKWFKKKVANKNNIIPLDIDVFNFNHFWNSIIELRSEAYEMIGQKGEQYVSGTAFRKYMRFDDIEVHLELLAKFDRYQKMCFSMWYNIYAKRKDNHDERGYSYHLIRDGNFGVDDDINSKVCAEIHYYEDMIPIIYRNYYANKLDKSAYQILMQQTFLVEELRKKVRTQEKQIKELIQRL